MAEVNAVPRPVIDAQLAYASADRFGVTEVPETEPADTNQNARPRILIPKCPKPVREDFGLTNFDHALTIVHNRKVRNGCALSTGNRADHQERLLAGGDSFGQRFVDSSQ